jgi:hypothetical protein
MVKKPKKRSVDLPTVMLAGILWAVTFAAFGAHAARKTGDRSPPQAASVKGNSDR